MFNYKDADVFFNTGVILSKSGKNNEALSAYDKAIRINPYDHKIHNEKGISLSE